MVLTHKWPWPTLWLITDQSQLNAKPLLQQWSSEAETNTPNRASAIRLQTLDISTGTAHRATEANSAPPGAACSLSYYTTAGRWACIMSLDHQQIMFGGNSTTRVVLNLLLSHTNSSLSHKTLELFCPLTHSTSLGDCDNYFWPLSWFDSHSSPS